MIQHPIFFIDIVSKIYLKIMSLVIFGDQMGKFFIAISVGNPFPVQKPKIFLLKKKRCCMVHNLFSLNWYRIYP